MSDNSHYIAALPMYDWPERRSEVDAEWASVRDALRARNIPAPDQLVRRNGDMPPVPGGILADDGTQIAADPASLDPDALDLHVLWRHPALIYAQTCYGPLELGLANHVNVIADPDYTGIEGGEGRFYSSAIVMCNDENASEPIPKGSIRAPSNGRAILPVTALAGKNFAFNSADSMSGYLSIARDLSAIGSGMNLFAQTIETGAHRASLMTVADGKADVAALDARSWALAQRFNSDITEHLHVVGWTARRPGLPFICARQLAHFYT